MNTTRFCVYIGRFQPFTKAHLETVRRGLMSNDKLILIVGSKNNAFSLRNIFSFEERCEIIKAALAEAGLGERVILKGIPDSAYNFNAWTTRVQEIVAETAGPDDQVSIIGHFKDDTSYYLSHFPSWELIKLPALAKGLSATQIRNQIFEGKNKWEEYYGDMPAGLNMIQALLEINKDRIAELSEEYEFIQAYKQKWAKAPFPPVFITTDAVVLCKGHILLIRRKLNPGKGKLAMPGGFLNQREAILEGAIRELKEETKIDVPYPILRSSITNQRVFDHPDRDPRGRMITHAYLFELIGAKGLPQVKAADDAKEAMWIPLAELDKRATEFFNDHLMIIKYFLGRSM